MKKKNASHAVKGKQITIIPKSDAKLLTAVASLIEQSKQRAAVFVNSELIFLYWNVGNLVRKNILQNKRAEYGEQIVISLSQQLTADYGKGWGEKQLNHCLRSAETFSKDQILYAVRRQLSWTHLRTIMYINNELQREFYLQICANERWSTRQLEERIDSMLYERTTISRKPAKLIKQELKKLKKGESLSHDIVFRDPYILDFLDLKDTYSEKDLESAIISELQRFISELGSDFAFIARQKRIIIDGRDYKMDLLFFHRKLKRLVVIDLKLGKFQPADKAQMELYLNWLEKHERTESEESPIGLILCADKSEEHIELLALNRGNIRVANYMTELPSKKLWQQKLHNALKQAQTQMAMNKKRK